ncbi:peptidoglycan DD-metalloendopeptidase family protein [Pelagibacterium xiamenense]|uniref:peptidoglycan DD-metalloendopeptidase family protein n=1 Tax=Pelagibacterium xiamenense TaxID=2901140 RepID=UPI001E4E5AAB|nr:peptidoglycan DD-metalloendopeptidase family protein [Pelagibacterium xiamenense]
MAASLVLAGCASLGPQGSDPTTTSSTTRVGGAQIGQVMPSFLPPANVGNGAQVASASGQPALIDRTTAQPVNAQQSAVVSSDLPALQSSSVTSTQAMPAQTAVASASQTPATPQQPAATQTPQLAVVSGDTYHHTIASGESLYTIARRYDVSATDIIAANNIAAPDQIRVGQQLVIPGRPDLLAERGQEPQQVASADSTQTLTAPDGTQAANVVTQTAAAPAAATAPAPTATSQQATQTASVAPQQSAPAAAETSDTFRWPLSGRVITDFAASKGTGINIEAPEGTTVRAAETGEVIYVGNAVEGYGNLVLVKHANGFVSAYAHLQNIGVVKGDTLSRGDAIGTVGMTGSVNRPQLHFELRRGATPVDPVPHLAG